MLSSPTSKVQLRMIKFQPDGLHESVLGALDGASTVTPSITTSSHCVGAMWNIGELVKVTPSMRIRCELWIASILGRGSTKPGSFTFAPSARNSVHHFCPWPSNLPLPEMTMS